MKLVFIWIRGSWKWTQGKILEQNFGFNIFETGWVLRKIAKQETQLAVKIRETIEQWKQVPSEIIEEILLEYIEKSNNWNIIFDWLIRNIWNKNTADKILLDYKVVFFELDRKEAEKRLLWRMYNVKTWETFPFWTEFDPKTGDKLESRKDDNTESIKIRIEEFYEKTVPLVALYKKDEIIRIDASKNVEEVTKELIEKLNLK